MASTHPNMIPGRWNEGYALDYHTIKSEFIGDNEFGHPQFATTRSEVGELLYRLKYKFDRSVITELVEAAAAFVATWKNDVDTLVPIPPSRARAVQPVMLLGEALANRLSIAFESNWIRRTQRVPELKNVQDPDERRRLLEGIHEVAAEKVNMRRILLFDDVYDRGTTMNAVTTVLYDQGGAEEVFALTITRTR